MQTPEISILIAIAAVVFAIIVIKLAELTYATFFNKELRHVRKDGRLHTFAKAIDQYIIWVAINISGARIKSKSIRIAAFCFSVAFYLICIAVTPWPFSVIPAIIGLLIVVGINRQNSILTSQTIGEVRTEDPRDKIEGDLNNEVLISTFSIIVIASGILAHLQLEGVGFAEVDDDDIFLYLRVIFFEILKAVSIVDYYDLFGSSLSYNTYVGADHPSDEVKILLFFFRVAFNLLLLGSLIKLIEIYRKRADGLDLRWLEDILNSKGGRGKTYSLHKLENFILYGVRAAKLNAVDVIKRNFFFKVDFAVGEIETHLRAHEVVLRFGMRSSDGEILQKVAGSLQSFTRNQKLFNNEKVANEITALMSKAQIYDFIINNKVDFPQVAEDRLASCAEYFYCSGSYDLSIRYFKAAAVSSAVLRPFDNDLNKYISISTKKVRKHHRKALLAARRVNNPISCTEILDAHRHLIKQIYFSSNDIAVYKTQSTSEIRRDQIVNKSIFFMKSNYRRSRETAIQFLAHIITASGAETLITTPLRRWEAVQAVVSYGNESGNSVALAATRWFFRKNSFECLVLSLEEHYGNYFVGEFLEYKILAFLGSADLADVAALQDAVASLEGLVRRRLAELQVGLTTSLSKGSLLSSAGDLGAFPIFGVMRRCAALDTETAQQIFLAMNKTASEIVYTLEEFRSRQSVPLTDVELWLQSFVDELSKAALNIDNYEMRSFAIGASMRAVRHFNEFDFSSLDENSAITILEWLRFTHQILNRSRSYIGDDEYASMRLDLIASFENLALKVPPEMDDVKYVMDDIADEICG